jgi:hypothetical protein
MDLQASRATMKEVVSRGAGNAVNAKCLGVMVKMIYIYI